MILRAIKRKRWLKGAIHKPGKLRSDVERTYGRHGFDRKGRIKCDVLKSMSKRPGKTGQRARLAMQLRGMSGVACPVPGRR